MIRSVRSLTMLVLDIGITSLLFCMSRVRHQQAHQWWAAAISVPSARQPEADRFSECLTLRPVAAECAVVVALLTAQIVARLAAPLVTLVLDVQRRRALLELHAPDLRHEDVVTSVVVA